MVSQSVFLFLRSQQVWGATSKGNDGAANGGGGGESARRRGRGTGSNLVLLLAYLYNYGVAHCTLVYDIIGRLVDGALLFELVLYNSFMYRLVVVENFLVHLFGAASCFLL